MFNLKLRPIARQYDEIDMGHCIWGYTVPGIDCVSATANCNGFTPLTSLMREYPWNPSLIIEACKRCNENDFPVFLGDLWPRLLLVPRTKGGSHKALTNAFAACLRSGNCRYVHFSHYGFLQSNLSLAEFDEILSALETTDGLTESLTLIVDMDMRRLRKANSFLERRLG